MDLVTVSVLVVVCGVLVAALAARRRDSAAVRAEMRALSQQLSSGSSVLAQRLEGIDSRMTATQAQNASMVKDIFATLGDVTRHTASVAEQAREFTLLGDLLRAPQPRGGLGEAMLEELLRQVLPPSAFATQHRFSSGVIVDAVVKMSDRLVCIDSKFPLSAYRRMCDAPGDGARAKAESAFAADVERHIKDISSRYVVPDEATLDFAIMYVPAEGLYGEVLRLSHRKRPLFETAIEARVIPMSPLTMYGYLQTLLFGLKCLSIEKSAEAVLGHCGRLQQDMKRFAHEYDTLGRHLTNARSKYEEGARRLDRFRDKLEGVVEIAGEEGPPPTLEAVRD
jgi:DNA recombination protein RmuC